MAFDHVALRVADVVASRTFYADVLRREPDLQNETFAVWDDFSLILRADGPPTTHAQLVLDAPPGFPSVDPDGNTLEPAGERGGGPVVALRLQVSDLDASVDFWDVVARALDARVAVQCVEGDPTRNLHVAFTARDNAQVDEFHRALTEAGYRDNGGPGERARYHAGYYGAFVLDPDGNNIEAVCHNR